MLLSSLSHYSSYPSTQLTNDWARRNKRRVRGELELGGEQDIAGRHRGTAGRFDRHRHDFGPIEGALDRRCGLALVTGLEEAGRFRDAPAQQPRLVNLALRCGGGSPPSERHGLREPR